jgi:putative ABC transport system permease protein
MPGFSAAAVITLALGVGANTAIFSVVKAVLLNQLPYRQPGLLVALGEADSGETHPETIGYTTAYDWRRLSHSFESMSLYRDAAGAAVWKSGPELLQGLRVNYDFFETLGIRMQLGRTFLPEEDRPDRRHEVILSDGLWKRRFGGDPDVIGRVIRMGDSSFAVVGVLPVGFRTLEIPGSNGTPEMFMPLGYDLSLPYACRDCQHLHLIARLRPGVSLSRAHAELKTIMASLVRQYPSSYPPGATVAMEPLHEYLVGSVRTALLVLLGAVGFVLLIACANVAPDVGARDGPHQGDRAPGGAGRRKMAPGPPDSRREPGAGAGRWASRGSAGRVVHVGTGHAGTERNTARGRSAHGWHRAAVRPGRQYAHQPLLRAGAGAARVARRPE